MRNNFISNAETNVEKLFWEQFFEEIEKRKFVEDAFTKKAVKKGFGIHIHNILHFSKKNKKLQTLKRTYSLMYAKEGSIFKMNNQKYNHISGDALNRLKLLCNTPKLPEQFYSELTNKKLLSFHKKYGEIIDIPLLLKYLTPSQLNDDLFQCIDLFR